MDFSDDEALDNASVMSSPLVSLSSIVKRHRPFTAQEQKEAEAPRLAQPARRVELTVVDVDEDSDSEAMYLPVEEDSEKDVEEEEEEEEEDSEEERKVLMKHQQKRAKFESATSSSSAVDFSSSPPSGAWANTTTHLGGTSKVSNSVVDKDQKKRLKDLEKIHKREQKEREAKLRQLEREANKKVSREDALKRIVCCVERRIVNASELGVQIMAVLRDKQIALRVVDDPVGSCVRWERRELKYTIDNGVITRHERDCYAPDIAVFLTADELETLLVSNKLAGHAAHIKHVYPKTRVTFIILGLVSHFGKKTKGTPQTITRAQVEIALVALQLDSLCYIRHCSSITEAADMCLQYTIAIAETPYLTEQKAFSFDAASLRHPRDNFHDAWLEQLMVVNGVSMEVALAIANVYPSVVSLLNAYQQCSTVEARNELLADIMVKRTAGLRRVGTRISAKLAKLYTSNNPDEVIY